jgi:hypothetical protein
MGSVLARFSSDTTAPSEPSDVWDRSADRSHFVIGPRGDPGIVALTQSIGGRLWDRGNQTLWTNVTPEGILRRRWRVRRSLDGIPPAATISESRIGFDVETDRFATFPVHALTTARGELRSDAADLLARVTDVEIDELSVAQLLLFGSILGPRSIVKGTRRNLPGGRQRPAGPPTGPAQIGEALVGCMRRIRQHEVVATLSGGNDSRGLVLAAHTAPMTDMTIVTAENGSGIKEPEIAAIVASDIGRPINVVRLPDDYCVRWMEPHAVACDYGWGGVNPWGFTIAEFARRRPTAFLLDGLGADYLLRNKWGQQVNDLASEMSRRGAGVGRRFASLYLGKRAETLGWALPDDVRDAAVERAISDIEEIAGRLAGVESSFGLTYLAARAAPAIVAQGLWWHDRSCFP